MTNAHLSILHIRHGYILPTPTCWPYSSQCLVMIIKSKMRCIVIIGIDNCAQIPPKTSFGDLWYMLIMKVPPTSMTRTLRMTIGGFSSLATARSCWWSFLNRDDKDHKRRGSYKYCQSHCGPKLLLFKNFINTLNEERVFAKHK